MNTGAGFFDLVGGKIPSVEQAEVAVPPEDQAEFAYPQKDQVGAAEPADELAEAAKPHVEQVEAAEPSEVKVVDAKPTKAKQLNLSLYQPTQKQPTSIELSPDHKSDIRTRLDVLDAARKAALEKGQDPTQNTAPENAKVAEVAEDQVEAAGPPKVKVEAAEPPEGAG